VNSEWRREKATITVLLIAVLLAGGCTGPIVAADNYLTYDHAFTDVEAERVRRNAETLCGQRKQMAIKTRSVCSLSRCTTDYQCVSKVKPEE